MHFQEPPLNTVSHHLALWNNLDEHGGEEDEEDDGDEEEAENEEEDNDEGDEDEEDDDWTVVPRAGDIQGEKRVGRRRSRNLFSTQ